MSNTDDSDGDDGAAGLFQEPEDFYQPEKQPTNVEHCLLNDKGHLLWNAGRTIADYIEANKDDLIKDKSVLELGAGAGLPSIVAALNGAKIVVVTDYPDADLIENLEWNVKHNCQQIATTHACGYLWGAETKTIKQYLPATEQEAGFDVLILADLLFNHSEHSKLVATVVQTLNRTPGAQALVFFTPYRPWLYEKDMAFFDLAGEASLEVTKIMEKTMEKVMFEEDPGLALVANKNLRKVQRPDELFESIVESPQSAFTSPSGSP
ncbi:Protein N-terminal and lysine N-methyltransferase efm7 [Recurvomyces mirabilis]|uniref:Protein N-terminal and lysine N-methyltransferase efm7 n=1 Tax=Recurvomyces mirabilis TaxID=574656 RepID=A0AAE0TUL9_9PEZI|nr:Protein N-terminal and lysine N-methyltransferase efm7 [Recurvomyces mirabilis]KAK5151657.1 Protein N-terminal and lysine N-methyltransferase efm7 [Recurvomyces mirabilis]